MLLISIERQLCVNIKDLCIQRSHPVCLYLLAFLPPRPPPQHICDFRLGWIKKKKKKKNFNVYSSFCTEMIKKKYCPSTFWILFLSCIRLWCIEPQFLTFRGFYRWEPRFPWLLVIFSFFPLSFLVFLLLWEVWICVHTTYGDEEAEGRPEWLHSLLSLNHSTWVFAPSWQPSCVRALDRTTAISVLFLFMSAFI